MLSSSVPLSSEAGKAVLSVASRKVAGELDSRKRRA